MGGWLELTHTRVYLLPGQITLSAECLPCKFSYSLKKKRKKNKPLNPFFIISRQGAWTVCSVASGRTVTRFKVSKPLQMKLNIDLVRCSLESKWILSSGLKGCQTQATQHRNSSSSSFLCGWTVIPLRTNLLRTPNIPASTRFCIVCITNGHKNTHRHVKSAAQVRSDPPAEQLSPVVLLYCCTHPPSP